MVIGAVEAGGTKMVMGIYDQEGKELARHTVPTLLPQETIPQMQAFLDAYDLDALGVGSFGPVDLNKNSPTYGYITTTSKPGWQNYPFLQALLNGRDIPTGFDTDVNAAAIAEVEMGVASGCQNVVYITVGTGVGGGVIVNGNPVHGLVHPEVGHMKLVAHPNDPNPRGTCPYHEGCLEGLAAGPGIGARVGGDARLLPDDHPTFDIEADYLAQMCANLIVMFSPEKIILGGGVMQRKSLYGMVQAQTLKLLNGYVQHDLILNHIEDYIVAPALYPVSGLVGSYLLGKRALLQG